MSAQGITLVSTLLAAAALQAVGALAPTPEWRPKERWRGFNLCSMFWHGKQHDPERPVPRFPEEDFALIREWGFNFARLPIDYRWFTHGGDWEAIDEKALEPVDEAIAFGRKHGVHVMLCLHRVPGYCINKCEEEPANLFESEEAKRVCEKYWRLFAKRYRGIPNDALTFNLMNEPPNIDDETYGAVARRLIAAIRTEDPERFVFSDGRCGGNAPSFSLVGMKGVAQSMRGYYPGSVSHYGASWVSTDWSTKPKPVWPLPESLDAPAGILAGRGKAEMRRPLVFENLPAGELALRFGTVSGDGTLVTSGDGQELGRVVLRPRVGDPLWPKARLHERWKIVQGRYAKAEKIALPRPVKRLEMLFEGDWCCLTEVAVESAGRRAALAVRDGWGRPQNFTQRFLGFDADTPFAAVGANMARRYADKGRETLWRKAFVEWRWGEMLDRGEFVMASEFGAYNQTPHAVALAWLEDNLRLWKELNVPWALWNLRGGFGVMDSYRKDVAYEDFRGHKLDRKMLELLQKY